MRNPLAHALGISSVGLGLVMLGFAIFSLMLGRSVSSFGIPGAVVAGGGALCLAARRRPPGESSQKEGVLLVCLVWIAVCTLGALPYYFSPYYPGFVDALFESVSGFTTTGSTVLDRAEILPPDFQLWRCATHWMGGLGVLLLGIAALPAVSPGGEELYRAECRAVRSEKLRSRLREALRAFWKLYAGLTLAGYLALRLAGTGSFDALCLSLSAVATGGFSNRSGGIGVFRSPGVEYALIAIMLLASLNFTRHYLAVAGRNPVALLRDPEIRFFFAVIAVAATLAFARLFAAAGMGFHEALRDSLFHIVSAVSGTAFYTDDYAHWHPFLQLILFSLIIAGGCTASTTGGLKTARVMILFKLVAREFKRMVERQGVFSIRLGEELVSEQAVRGLLNIVYLAFTFFVFASLTLAATGVDVVSSFTAAAASMFNAGPGLGSLGPAGHYGDLTAAAKWTLCVCMLAGRLEFYSLFVIFTPAFWRR